MNENPLTTEKYLLYIVEKQLSIASKYDFCFVPNNYTRVNLDSTRQSTNNKIITINGTLLYE